MKAENGVSIDWESRENLGKKSNARGRSRKIAHTVLLAPSVFDFPKSPLAPLESLDTSAKRRKADPTVVVHFSSLPGTAREQILRTFSGQGTFCSAKYTSKLLK